MPSRAITKRGTAGVKAEAPVKEELGQEENIYRPPDSSDDEVDAGDIQKTDFMSASEQRQEQKRKDIDTAKQGKKGIAVANGNPTTNTRPRRGKLSQASSQSNDSPKRKNQEDGKPIGTGMTDAWGMVKVKKARTSTYGGRKVSRTAPEIKHGSPAIILSA